MSTNDEYTPELEPPTNRRDKPPAGADDASQTLRLGNGAIRVSKQGIGITLQTGTLITLLGIGWQAKNALEDQLDEVERTRTEFDARHAELERDLREISSKIETNAIGVGQVIAIQSEVTSLRDKTTKLEDRIDDLVEDLRRLRP